MKNIDELTPKNISGKTRIFLIKEKSQKKETKKISDITNNFEKTKSIIDKYIEREYTNNGIPLVMKRMKMKDDIRRKLLRIITYANQFPNKLETKITLIKNELLKELR